MTTPALATAIPAYPIPAQGTEVTVILSQFHPTKSNLNP